MPPGRLVLEELLPVLRHMPGLPAVPVISTAHRSAVRRSGPSEGRAPGLEYLVRELAEQPHHA